VQLVTLLRPICLLSTKLLANEVLSNSTMATHHIFEVFRKDKLWNDLRLIYKNLRGRREINQEISRLLVYGLRFEAITSCIQVTTITSSANRLDSSNDKLEDVIYILCNVAVISPFLFAIVCISFKPTFLTRVFVVLLSLSSLFPVRRLNFRCFRSVPCIS
jgi:hypothetical protein